MDQALSLESGATAVRVIAFDATHDVTVAAAVRSTSTEVERIDVSIFACGASGTFEQTEPAEWHRLEGTASSPAPGFSSDIRIEGPCSRSSGAVELRITNLGPHRTSLIWHAEAATFGPEDEAKAPSGAFVHVLARPVSLGRPEPPARAVTRTQRPRARPCACTLQSWRR